MSTETKIFKKCNFVHRNDRIWLKNDDSPGESFPLTYFQSKSCTNLPQTEFWHKKKKTTETKILKNTPLRRPKRWNLAENDEPLTESYLFTHFESKSCTNLSETEFWHKKNEHRNEKFLKMQFRIPQR